MKYFKWALISLPLLSMELAFAAEKPPYDSYYDDMNVGTFKVQEGEELKPNEQLRMQKEEAAAELDSFGQDEYNENNDPDTLETNEKFNLNK